MTSEAARVSVRRARESMQKRSDLGVDRFVFESNWLELTYFGNEIKAEEAEVLASRGNPAKACHTRSNLLVVRLARTHLPA